MSNQTSQSNSHGDGSPSRINNTANSEHLARERNAFYASFYRDSPASAIASGLQINTGPPPGASNNMPALVVSRPSSAASSIFTPRSPHAFSGSTKSPTHALSHHNAHYHPYSGGGGNGSISGRPSSGRVVGLNVINSMSQSSGSIRGSHGSSTKQVPGLYQQHQNPFQNQNQTQAQTLLKGGSVRLSTLLIFISITLGFSLSLITV
jgi:hypothetical protein